MRMFPKYFDKIEIAFSPVVRSAVKPSQVGFAMYRFGWCEREVQENSVAREWVDSRFWKCAPFSEMLRSLDDFYTFCTLPILTDQERCKWILPAFVRPREGWGRCCTWFGDTKHVTGHRGCLHADLPFLVFVVCWRSGGGQRDYISEVKSRHREISSWQHWYCVQVRVCHVGSPARHVPRSVSTCLPRGNLVDGLPRAPSASLLVYQNQQNAKSGL